MKVEDAPSAGWYPDPRGGARLRWWNGLDWEDRWRAPPTPGVKMVRTSDDDLRQADLDQLGSHAAQMHGFTRKQSEEIVTQVRQAARAEAERAAQMFGHQARQMHREIAPLITQYTSKLLRWVRFVIVVGVILGVAWVAWQIFWQVAIFDWIGDRIDNIFDRGSDEPVEGMWWTGFL